MPQDSFETNRGLIQSTYLCFCKKKKGSSPGLTVTLLGLLNSNGININAADVDLGVYELVHPTQNQIGDLIDAIGNNIDIIYCLLPLIAAAMGLT